MTSASVTSSLDPSAVALTTVFTPASTCSGLTFSAPSYSVWYNEPVPAPTMTESGCYPSQWLIGYTSLSTSSVAVALNPLVCPLGWTTALNSTSNYVACCPSGYNVHPPASAVDAQRPAYGGLCFSPFDAGTSLTVVLYNTTGSVSTETQTVPFSVSGQVFAHVIDGYATRHVAATSDGLSAGAIAGIVIGCAAGVVALLVVGFCFLRQRKQKQSVAVGQDTVRHESGATAIYETDSAAVMMGKDGFLTASKPQGGVSEAVELSTGSEAAHEMSSPSVVPEPAELASPLKIEYSHKVD